MQLQMFILKMNKGFSQNMQCDEPEKGEKREPKPSRKDLMNVGAHRKEVTGE